MPERLSKRLEVRGDPKLFRSLNAIARVDGKSRAQVIRTALESYSEARESGVDRLENHEIWVAITALAAFALTPAAVDGLIVALKSYNSIEQMASRPPSEGMATVVKVLSEREQIYA